MAAKNSDLSSRPLHRKCASGLRNLHDGVVERLAVADLGSNSFRLVVYAYEPGRWWQHADEIREAVRISEGMGDDGVLGEEPMRRALRTVEVFDAFCNATGVAAVEAVATSAIREASNREELLHEVSARTSIPVRVLSTGEYHRCSSYFDGIPEFMATGLPEGLELEMLQPLRDTD